MTLSHRILEKSENWSRRKQPFKTIWKNFRRAPCFAIKVPMELSGFKNCRILIREEMETGYIFPKRTENLLKSWL